MNLHNIVVLCRSYELNLEEVENIWELNVIKENQNNQRY